MSTPLVFILGLSLGQGTVPIAFGIALVVSMVTIFATVLYFLKD